MTVMTVPLSKSVRNHTLGSSWFRNLGFASVSKSMKSLVQGSAVNDSAVNKKYMDTIIELVDAIIILTLIRHKFCSIGAGQERQSDEMLQYVLLPILLGTAKKAADITKTTLQSFWRNLLPSDVGILLSTCSGMAQVVNGAKDIDSKTLGEVTAIIQQLKDCLDKINVFKNFNKISLGCIASMCSQERLSMELSIGQ